VDCKLLLAAVAAGAIGLALPSIVHGAPDVPRTVMVRYAYGDETNDVGVHARWLLPVIESIPGQPQLFAEGGIDYWRATGAASGNNSLFDLSAVAGLRWRATPSWFIDTSFGPHLLSGTHIKNREFGIALQFGSRLATGFVLGEERRHELAVFVEHVSNASIAQPNNGMTFFGAEYRYTLR